MRALLVVRRGLGEGGSSSFDFGDDDTGEVLAVADIAWPQGIQPGRTQPVALMLAPDAQAETHLGERGYRFFTSRRRLVWHLEELLGVDIVSTPSRTPRSEQVVNKPPLGVFHTNGHLCFTPTPRMALLG